MVLLQRQEIRIETSYLLNASARNNGKKGILQAQGQEALNKTGMPCKPNNKATIS